MHGPLLTLCAGVGTLGDLHCAFSHTSLRGAAGILSLQKEKWAKREREREKKRKAEKQQRKSDGENEGNRWSKSEKYRGREMERR